MSPCKIKKKCSLNAPRVHLMQMLLIIQTFLILTNLSESINFKFDRCLKTNLQTIHYPIFDDLNKFMIRLLHEEKSEI